MRWVFIGAGNMASSLIGGLVNSGNDANDITVVDPSTEACEKAQTRFGVQAGASLQEVLVQNDEKQTTEIGFVLSVKPNIVQTACTAISAWLQVADSAGTSQRPLIVSVAAGVRASSMAQWLPENTPIVRCMPNTPALLGLGATALYANERCQDPHKEEAQRLLNTAGTTLWVEKEANLDAVTAVSGSGPAYFFFLIEQMSLAGMELGLDEETALNLSIDTAFGAASMARLRDLKPSTLRENVTSKGGTTAAALQVFVDRQMPDIVQKAMQAAHDRAVEMGDEFAPD